MSAHTAAQVLVIDDEEDHAEVMGEVLKRMGHVCTLVHSLPAAVDELKHGVFDLVVTDLHMDAEDDGMKVLEAARAGQSDAAVVMVTAHGDVPTAKAAIRGGAYDFIEKPLDLDVFRTLCGNAIEAVFLRSQNQHLRREVEEARGFEGMLGTSAAMRQLSTQIEHVAPAPLPVLVTGESGTGKELVAQAIHRRSKRSSKLFVAINCAGLSESILEDELFGHVRGAFTGAEKDRQGRFEYASGGTMFLDEIGDMPKPMQAKLLRVLESGEVVRLGSNEPRHVDVRLVSATNADLDAMVKEGTFREDLYFRIRGMELHLPPLRGRREDVPILVRHFLVALRPRAGQARARGRPRHDVAALGLRLAGQRPPAHQRGTERAGHVRRRRARAAAPARGGALDRWRRARERRESRRRGAAEARPARKARDPQRAAGGGGQPRAGGGDAGDRAADAVPEIEGVRGEVAAAKPLK